MAEAAYLPLPYPETGVVEADSLAAQRLAVASDLPERPVVLGGCCCAHIGAVEALAARRGRLALVWLDAHGDLNTPASSPSGNEWGMPLRMLLDAGVVAPADVALVGARSLDPPERTFIETVGLHVDGEDAAARALAGVEAAYVAIDGDVLREAEIRAFMPEPGGLSVNEAERLLRAVAARAEVVGVGVSGLRPDAANVAPITRLLAALGL
jgi:arginase